MPIPSATKPCAISPDGKHQWEPRRTKLMGFRYLWCRCCGAEKDVDD